MIVTQLYIVVNLIIEIEGNNSAISTSKIKKIIVIKKNRNEKGKREDDFGSNPHSKGEHFSRSIKVFFDKIEARSITALAINIITIPKINVE